ncbi:nucleotidyl transferase AbiEii/AbiGii toxin family protein [bacterium]|nr:nucleotidyl transferase AbiEii/AbiGii toxin family protein [bacterium]
MKGLNNLAKETEIVFEKLSHIKEMSDFVFVGGSALAIYLNHRVSEDIDLFTWKKVLDKETLLKRIKDVFSEDFSIENITKEQLDLKIQNVKVTFFANGWDELENYVPFVNNINIAPIKLLTGMKLNTLFLRAKFRDYYDLFVINKEVYSLTEMYDIIKHYMPEINEKLFQMSLLYTKDVEEDKIQHLNPKYDISIEEISEHFRKKIQGN